MADTEMQDQQLEELRSENARLKARNEQLEHGGAKQGPGRWRWPTAIVLLVIGGLLLLAAVPAVWAGRTLLNTDRYTETVAPLASDPNIRSDVAVATVNGIFSRVDVQTQVRDALPPRAAFLAPQIASGLRSFSITAAERALATPQFQTLWTEANRRAHERIVPALLNGTSPSGAVGIQNGTVTLDLSQAVAQVKQALVSRGLTFVNSVPVTASGQITLLQSAQLAQAQTILRAVQVLAYALPIAALVFFVAAVFVAPDRRRALLWLGVTAIVAMLVLGIGLAIGRNAYVSSPPAGILSGAAATAFFDTLVRFLRNSIRTVAAVGLVFLIGAALAGPSTVAVRLRNAVTGGMSALGLDLGRPAVWTDRHQRALIAAIIVIAAVILFATNTPTPGLVIGLAIAVLVAILLVELVAHAHPTTGPTYRGVAGT